MSDTWEPADHGSERDALQRRVAQGLGWTVVDAWGRQALNFVVFLILARLLVAHDFGLVALAAVFVNFAQLIVDQGMGDALIQRKVVSRSQIDTAFWVAIAMGLFLTAAGIGLSAPIGMLLGAPGIIPILRVLSLTFVLAAISSIQIALLRRELAFQSLALRSIVAALGGGVVGIVMAYLGYGAWALVGQLVASAVVSVVTLWQVSPWRPGFQLSRRDFGDLFGFGINIMGSDVLRYLSRNVDNLLVGAVLGTTPLGFYAVGYRILDVSQTLLVQVSGKVTFPVFSKLQHDPERLVRAFVRVSRAAAFVILPGYVALAIVASELIVFLFGVRWRPSAPVASVLFLIGPVLSVQAFNDALLNANGRPDVALRLRFISTVTNLVGFAIGVWFGIVAVAAAFSIRGYVLLPLYLTWMRRYGGVPIRGYLLELWRTGAATVVMAAAMLGAKWMIGRHLHPASLLAVELGCGAVTFLASIWILDRGLVREVLTVGSQAVPGLERLWHRSRRIGHGVDEPPSVDKPDER